MCNSAPYQVGLSINGCHLVSEHVARAVSIAYGGNGEVSLEDSRETWNLWNIDLPDLVTPAVWMDRYGQDIVVPFDGTVDVIDENGEIQHVKVEIPRP